jgi:serine/threonine protein phosphatase PrpC
MSRSSDDTQRKPTDDEIDVFGLTHPGKVREHNEDHFLVCHLRKHIDVDLTSLPPSDLDWAGAERLAIFAMVADGVGGNSAGEVASRTAIAAVTRYVAESIDAYYTADATDHDAFTGALHGAALRVHHDLVEAGEADPSKAGMATTLTLFIGVWPYIYLLQVGDSRYYVLRDGTLHQGSRDQTVGQALVDDGVLTDSQAVRLSVAPMLSSTIGGAESAPVVQRLDSRWGCVHMLCSDGLTKHVTDEQIRTRLSEMTSARGACEALLQDALDGGGTDNITVIVGRAVKKE